MVYEILLQLAHILGSGVMQDYLVDREYKICPGLAEIEAHAKDSPLHCNHTAAADGHTVGLAVTWMLLKATRNLFAL